MGAIKTRPLLFLVGFALLVYLRLLIRASYFPPYFEGEEAQALDIAKSTFDYAHAHSWFAAVMGSIPQYNKGYGWALVPLYAHFGYDVRIIPYVLPLFFGLFVAAFFTLFKRAYPKTPLAAFVLVAFYSVLCLCLRRYKWHSMTYLTAISIYVYFLPLYGNVAAHRAKLFRWLGIGAFLASLFFYFGGLIYAVPLVGLILANSSKEQRRRELWRGAFLAAAFLALAVGSFFFDNLWHWRIRDVLSLSARFFTLKGLGYRLDTTNDYFFTIFLSFPFLILFVAGMIASFRRMRQGDRFAQINTVLFLSIWGFELVIEGVNNPDQLNWSMIPSLGVFLIGASTSLEWLRARFRHGTALGLVLVAIACWNELRHYPIMNASAGQTFNQDRNTRSQAALVLRMIGESTEEGVVFYLPDPLMTEAEGGFDYSVSLKRVDYAKALSKVTFFKGEKDLRRKLLAQDPSKTAVVYLSVGYPAAGAKDTIRTPILGQRPILVHPYEDIYITKYLVRSYRIKPSQLPTLQLEDMALWLRSTDGTEGQRFLKVWLDQSGLANDATPIRDDHAPMVVPRQINGLPVVRFGGATALRLPENLMEKSRTGEIIAVVRIGKYPDNLNVLWDLGTGWGSTYKDAAHFEDFGNGDTHAITVETLDQTREYFVYDTSLDAAGNLIYRRNGTPLLFKHVTEAQFQPIPSIGGYGFGSFYGDIAEIILYKRALTESERMGIYSYLAKKFQMPAITENLRVSRAHSPPPIPDPVVSPNRVP